MTDDEALRILTPLVVLTSGWDDPKATAWIQKLAPLDPRTAANVIDQIVATWTDIGAPPWAVFHEAYRNELTQRAANQRQPALPTPHADRVTKFLGDWDQRPEIIQHNHRGGVDNCPSCSRHHGCSTGFCPRCREIELWMTQRRPHLITRIGESA